MTLIETPTALEQVSRELAAAKVLFLDTEFESNRGGSQLCLLQISDGKQVYLIDALRLRNLEILQRALLRHDCEWVLHAGLQDIALITQALRADHNPVRIFDTQIAWALLSVEASVSLAYLAYRVLAIRSIKTHQADDWTRRPLPPAQLAYARSDIEHLPALSGELHHRAQQLGRLEWIWEASTESVSRVPEAPQPLALHSFRNAWQLDVPRQSALLALVHYFNTLPASEQWLEAKALLSVASRLPDAVSELARIKGVPARWAAEHGTAVIERLRRARAQAEQNDFCSLEPRPYATEGEIRLNGWLEHARAEVCAALKVAPELALPAHLLRGIRSRVLDQQDLRFEGMLETLSGFRRELLSAPLREFEARVRWPFAAEGLAPT